MPPSDPYYISTLKAESGITAMVMDDLNAEGIYGTENGSLFYLNIAEKQQIRVVSRIATGLDRVNHVKFDPANQAVFMTSCG